MARLYSQRMLNPFHGIVNIAEIEGSDAVCRDGINWTLYIQGGMGITALEDGGEARVSLPDIKFGTWSSRDGLRRAPVRFVTDYDQLDALGRRLLELVKSAADRVPFPLQDDYELWLLDARPEALPLAVLQSSPDPVGKGRVEMPRWTAGQRARASFGLSTEDVRTGDVSAADRLTDLVNAAAGPVPVAQWFRRQPHGGGLGLFSSSGNSDLEGRLLPLDAFPELLLRQHWNDAADRDLVRAFLSWRAPWLLALQGLRPATRSRLEKDACGQAVLLSELYPTYPEIVDTEMLKAARVEARLRLAAGGAGERERPAATSFFVTGN